MTTKVRKLTGGIPSLPGEEGTTNQILTKLSNSPGDYGWRDPSIPTPTEIRSNTSENRVNTEDASGEIRVTVGTSSNNSYLRMLHREKSAAYPTAGPDLWTTYFNGIPFQDYLNPADAPEFYNQMTASGSINTNRLWTAGKIQTLINGTVGPNVEVPIGTVMMWVGAVAPTNYLILNGQYRQKTTFQDLYDLLTTQGWNVETPTPSSNFVLPDFRGLFPRGLDGGKGFDANPGRAIGSVAMDTLKSHRHNLRSNTSNSGPNSSPAFITNFNKTTSYYTEYTGGAETAPKNIAINFIIKAL